MSELKFSRSKDGTFGSDWQASTQIWGKQTWILVDFDGELDQIWLNLIEERLNFVRRNRDLFVSLLLHEGVLSELNEQIACELKTKDVAEIYPLKFVRKLTEQEFGEAIFVAYLSFYPSDITGEVKFNEQKRAINLTYSVDIDAQPDYLLGHLAHFILEGEEIRFDSLNG